MRIRSKWRLFLVSVLFTSSTYITLYPNLCRATSFYPQPFPTTVQEAPVIVRGKVGRNYTDWSTDADGGRRLFTYFELEVTEIIKGNANKPSLIMREMGGEKDGIGLHIPGTSSYTSGEDVVVFLKEKNSEGSYDVQGMMMGKYNLQTDPDGKEYLIGAGLNQNPIINEETTQQNAPTRKWYIEDVRDLVTSQGNKPSDSSQKKQNSQPSASSPPSPITSRINPSMSISPAPQLQSSLPEESDSHRFFYYLSVGLGVLVVIGLLFKLLKVMRHRK